MSKTGIKLLSVLAVVALLVTASLLVGGCGGSGIVVPGPDTVAGASELPSDPEANVAPSAGGGKDASASNPNQPADDKVSRAPAAIAEPVIVPMANGDLFVVDQDEASRVGPPQWFYRVVGYGADGDMHWTYVNGNAVSNYVVWRSGRPAGRYQVEVFIPRNYATTQNARYCVEWFSSDGQWHAINWVTVNQNSLYDAWVNLGTYDFAGEPAVYLSDQTGESYSTRRKVGFDQVRFIDRSVVVTPPPPADRFGLPLASYQPCSYNFGQFVSGRGYHVGQDVRGATGTPVFASAAGKVVQAESHSGYGLAVVIDHGDVCSVYGHMRVRDKKVSVGQQVSRGQLLGYLGTSAENGGWAPHLHWGIRKGRHTGTWRYYGYGTAGDVANWENPTNWANSR